MSSEPREIIYQNALLNKYKKGEWWLKLYLHKNYKNYIKNYILIRIKLRNTPKEIQKGNINILLKSFEIVWGEG